MKLPSAPQSTKTWAGIVCCDQCNIPLNCTQGGEVVLVEVWLTGATDEPGLLAPPDNG